MANINPNENSFQNFLAEGGSVIQNTIVLDGHIINAWTISQTGSGGWAYAFTLIHFAGPRSPATYYAAVWVAKSAGPHAFPAPHSAGLTAKGILCQSMRSPVHALLLKHRAISELTRQVTYVRFVNLSDTSTSIEFRVELYPSGLGVFDGFPSAGQQTAPAAVFTVRDVSIGAHP